MVEVAEETGSEAGTRTERSARAGKTAVEEEDAEDMEVRGPCGERDRYPMWETRRRIVRGSREPAAHTFVNISPAAACVITRTMAGLSVDFKADG